MFFQAFVDTMQAAAQAATSLRRGHSIGPGRSSIFTVHRPTWHSKYSG